jgi:hypothetical protein
LSSLFARNGHSLSDRFRAADKQRPFEHMSGTGHSFSLSKLCKTGRNQHCCLAVTKSLTINTTISPRRNTACNQLLNIQSFENMQGHVSKRPNPIRTTCSCYGVVAMIDVHVDRITAYGCSLTFSNCPTKKSFQSS